MSTPYIVIIADDLTGAADTCAYFALAGLTTLVSLSAERYPAADVLGISTHSRHLTAEESFGRVKQAITSVGPTWRASDSTWVYKKVDSTLRGNPGAELAAMMETLGADSALVAPAFPAQGRTTVDGHQWVNGHPLECSAFRHQVHTSSLETLFQVCAEGRHIRLIDLDTVRRGARAIRRALTAPRPAVFIADAETDSDLRSLVQAAATADIRLLCGSAGLARALGRFLELTPAVSMPKVPALSEGPVLVVAGSRHPRTIRQIEISHLLGVTVLQAKGVVFDMCQSFDSQSAAVAGHYLSRGKDVVLTTAGLGDSPHDEPIVAARLGHLARTLAAEHPVGGLVLTGGDTAVAVFVALGSTVLWLRGEVEPGIPWGQLLDGECPGMPIVTKAGGFGADAALIHAIQQLKGKSRFTERRKNLAIS